ncbi:MAG: DUF6508 domain-containing protein, partial [Anaerolineaceae bacterium]
LKIFDSPGFQPVTAWSTDDLPEPVYHPAVEQFFALLRQSPWIDPAYSPQQAAKLAEAPERILTASLDEIRGLITWCVRGERFSSGHWAAVIQKGIIALIFRRLQQIAGH